jgi:RHS repeat-associated protein
LINRHAKNVFVYKPFGEVTSLAGNLSDERHRFNGNQQDSAGILDYDARSYTPGLGIFLQPDSMVPDYENPQALNRYSYVFNNPLNLTDPTGHAPAKEGDQHRNSRVFNTPGRREPTIARQSHRTASG